MARPPIRKKISARPLWALTAAICLAGPLAAQSFNFKVYLPRDGLPQNQAKALYQDSRGYLWVGTYSGLARYNGREWKIFTKENGLTRNEINALGEDAKGRVLIGSRDGGLMIYDGASFFSFPAGSMLGSGEVTDILTDADGVVWVATREGLALLDQGEVREFGLADGLPALDCLDIHQRRDGSIWAATAGGVVQFNGDRFKKPALLEGAAELGQVRMMIEDRNGKLYFGTENSLFVLDQRELRRIDRPEFEGATFNDAAVDRRGRLWFATHNRGALCFDGERVDAYTTANGLSYDLIYCLAIDRENNLWFGTDDGLNKLSEGPFVVFDKRYGLAHNIVRAMYQDRDGVIWLGTRDGVNSMIDDQLVDIVDNRQFEDRTIYSIGQHPDGRMLFGTLIGMTVFDRNTGEHLNLNLSNGLLRNNIRAIIADRRGQVWLGGEGLCRWTGSGFSLVHDDGALSGVRILDMLEDRKGRLWLATRQHGVTMYDPDSDEVKSYTRQFDEIVWTLDLDQRDNLWIGTNGLGLFKYDGEQFVQYDKSAGLTNGFVWQVLCASNGDVWAGHNLGVDQFSQGRFVNYNVADGVADNESVATACLEDRRGNLWFSSKGVTKYRANLPVTPPATPIAHIEQVEVEWEGGRETLRPGASLARSQNNLRFSYAGVFFRNEAEVRYRYKLEGIDDDWRAPTTDAFAPYNNLPRGDYRFVVKAANASGVYGEPAEFRFTVRPAYWETWLFRGMMAMLLVIVGGGYHRTRMVRMKRRNVILEDLVLARTRELADKNEELRQLSLSDSLTKLRNRRFLSEMMPVEIDTLRRVNFEGQKNGQGNLFALGFMMVDLDHFKKVNDTYGHDVGDRVLQQTAAAFREVVRGSDIVARWGGEEFLILLKEIKRGMLGMMARRVLRKVRDMRVDLDGGQSLSCTCSIGFAYFPGHREADRVHWEDVVKLADKALYMAKDAGRDRALGLGFNPKLSGVEIAELLRGDLQQGVDCGAFIEIDSDA